MNEPKIRFKGFRGEWNEQLLDDCVIFLDSQRKPIEEGNRVKGVTCKSVWLTHFLFIQL